MTQGSNNVDGEDIFETIIAEMLDGPPNAPYPSPTSSNVNQRKAKNVQAGSCSVSKIDTIKFKLWQVVSALGAHDQGLVNRYCVSIA